MRGRTLLAATAVVLAATALSLLAAPPGTSAQPAAPPRAQPGGPARAAATLSARPAQPPAQGNGAASAQPADEPAAPPSGAASAPPPPAAAALRATSDRVVAYTLAAELVPDTHTVRGTGTMVWRNTSRVAADRLYVHLYLNAFKDGRTVFWRVPTPDFRGDPLDGPGRIDVERFFARELAADLWPTSPTTPGDPEDATDIEVPLPRPIQPGESLTIDMAWTSHLPTVTLRTGYSGSFHMVAQWFPKIARLEPDGTWAHFPFHRLSEFYADYGTYDVTITAPASFTVGAVGTLVSQGPAPPAPPATSVAPATSGDAPAATDAPTASAAAPATTDPPAASADAPAADRAAPGAAPKIARRFTAEDVHDFAFTAWDGFRTLEETTADGVKVTCLFPDGFDAMARAEIAAVKFGLGYFGAAFGRYPYATLTVVHPPEAANEAGGMEYPTLITTGGSWTRGPVANGLVEFLTLHELAHNWFYGLVGSNEHSAPFLDEGLTSYAEMDASEAMMPDASAVQAFGFRVGSPAVYRAGALEATRHAPVTGGAADFVSGGDYGALVYSRTATAMRSLANVYGEDAVRRAVGLYARRFRFAHPKPADFFAVMREALGAEPEEALRAALAEPSSVDYVAAAVASEPRKDGKPGYAGYALVRRLGSIRLPVDVLLIAEDGSRRQVRWDAAGAAERIPYEGDTPLVAAVVDPEHRVLLDDDLTNNAVSASGRSFAWRTFEGGAFLGGLLARAVLP